MSSPIGEAVTLDPERVREHEERQTGGPVGVPLPKRIDPREPEQVLAALAGKPGDDAVAVCEERIAAAYAEARRWELVKLALERVRRGAV